MSGADYKAYTTKFDIEVDAAQLDTVLGPLVGDHATALDHAWQTIQTGLLDWRTNLHIVAAEADGRLRSKLSKEQLRDTSVALLFDQSGSMRGQKVLFAAATADVVQEFLSTMGVSVEVLGFTTSSWKGGRSRRRWNWRFRPRNPGRLNDLLHIVYKQADDRRSSTGGWTYRQMLRHDLTKENIDGEAIEWAAGRLRSRPAARRLLLVLSDGAPVDNSTLMENGPTFLGDHLRSVVTDLVASRDICIAAFGIGYAVHEFYPSSAYVDAPREMGEGVIALLERMLIECE